MGSRPTPLLETTPLGLYCRLADIFLDPRGPVERALITHAHSDHARPGSKHYLAHHVSVPLVKARLNLPDSAVQGIGYGESLRINGVAFTFFPAGHVPGSAQILVEHGGERWVYSGDYKTTPDGVSTPFEPVACQVFISECTFGLPIFRWAAQREVFSQLHEWWRGNRERGVTSVVCAYSLGKAQRIFAHLDRDAGPILVHGAVWNMCEQLGMDMSKARPASAENVQKGVLLLAPPAIAGSAWLRRFEPYSLAAASGWMSIRGMKRRRGIEKGFVLSDHADFEGLTAAIRATRAETVLLTHGYTALFSRYLREQGIDARELELGFAPEEAEE